MTRSPEPEPDDTARGFLDEDRPYLPAYREHFCRRCQTGWRTTPLVWPRRCPRCRAAYPKEEYAPQ